MNAPPMPARICFAAALTLCVTTLVAGFAAHAIIYTNPYAHGRMSCLFLEDYTQDIREMDPGNLADLIRQKQECIDRGMAEGRITWHVVVQPGNDKLTYQPFEPMPGTWPEGLPRN